MTPLDMFLAGVGLEGRPDERRPADAVALGRRRPAHRVAVERHRHAVPAGRRLRRSRRCSTSASPTFPTANREFKPDEVTYVSVGDGATSEGEFWESLNAACLRKLPVLFLVEDNGYAISVPVEAQTPGGSISRLVESFPDLKVIRCDGTDVLASHRAMTEAVAWCRERRGPALVHATVIRPYSHSHSDDERAYKTPAERADEAARDPIPKFAAVPASSTASSPTPSCADIAHGCRSRNQRSRGRRRSRRPSRRQDTRGPLRLFADVDPDLGRLRRRRRTRRATRTRWSAAINRTLKDEMAANPRIVVFGEDVADATHEDNLAEVQGKGGVFKVTLGLQRAFGSDRVFNSHARRSGHRRPRRAAWARAG